MKRILAQVRKELTQLWRDRLTLALALVLPILLLLLLSKATSLSVKDIPVAVQDLDNTPMSRQYLEAVSSSLSFKLDALPTNVSPEHVLAQTGSKSKLVFRPLPSDDPKQRQPDIRLAKMVLGWSPTTGLKKGLEGTIEFFRRWHGDDHRDRSQHAVQR